MANLLNPPFQILHLVKPEIVDLLIYLTDRLRATNLVKDGHSLFSSCKSPTSKKKSKEIKDVGVLRIIEAKLQADKLLKRKIR